MRIDIHTNNIEMTEDVRFHTERCINFGLDWAKHDVSRVIVTLSDINGPRGGNDKQCQVRIPLARMQEILIKEISDDLQVAISHSVERAARSLERRLSRQREFDRSQTV